MKQPKQNKKTFPKSDALESEEKRWYLRYSFKTGELSLPLD